ncbi:hypothetical protein GCM10023084_21090 [Streptomyces lacrimifluminis]|uniref:Uncharacterized protein n=1 Tax=Streptomyces lacrimifluminis TaxID=1500077 RepID=A0A917NWA5_9ACTN|nr:hypothetical protein [Streptomyces lacrimifluminis]GGJ35417.1 hypothetical protein GCM10012282_35300 [Streptomyces lacrimifluminis]
MTVPETNSLRQHETEIRHHVSRAELRGTRVRLAGYAYLRRVETHDITTELVLRERESGTEYRLPVAHTASPCVGAEEDEGQYSYERAGFEAAFDIDSVADGSPLDDGLWDISLAVGAQGLTREVRIGSSRADRLPGRPDVRITETVRGRRAVTLYTTVPYGNYTIDLGERKHPVLKRITFGDVRWHAGRPTELLITGRCTLGAYPRGALTVHLRNEEEPGTTVVFTAVRPPHGEQFSVQVPVAELGPGVWSGELRLGERVLPLPPLPKGLGAVKWWRRSGLWYAKAASRPGGGFALRVGRTGKRGLVRAAVRL